MPPVRVLTLWRHRALGEALAAALEADDRIAVVAVTGDPDEAARFLARPGVDAVLVDASLDLEPVLALVSRFREEAPRTRLLPFSVPDAEAALALVEAGATSFLPSEASLAEVADAVVDVHRGGRAASMEFAARVARRIEELLYRSGSQTPEAGEGVARLSDRELEVLALVARGLSNKEIAHRMDIRTATVKNHVHSILQRLGVPNRTDAVRAGYERGLLRGPLRWRTLEDEE
jgi:DNA-binding NarL/FixJ family response regulator